LNINLFIAKRIFFKKEKNKSIAKPIVTIATYGIALGIAVMLLSVSVVVGFKKDIKDKISGFNGHIQIKNYSSNETFEDIPISKNQDFIAEIKKIDEIKSVQEFISKIGMIKTKTQNEAILLKGITENYNWDFINKNLVEGEALKFSDTGVCNNIIISETISKKLQLKIGDDIRIFFILNNETRARKLKICGIYNTGFAELDKLIAFVDIRHLQKLNNWDKDKIGGFEIVLNDFDDLEKVNKDIFDIAGYKIFEDGSKVDIISIEKLRPDIFNWLAMLDINVWIILFIMIAVAIINMISALLIIILERTNMIGILKVLGSKNWDIRKIFLYNAFFIISKGLIIGNALGLSIAFIQKYFQVFTLPPESYSVSNIPIYFSWEYFLLLNICTIIISIIVLIVPTFIITKIQLTKTIKYQ